MWLSDKWLSQIKPNDPKRNVKLREAVKSMQVFLDYREKYYGSLFKSSSALEREKELLQGLTEKNDETAIRSKLTEYKKWWDRKK